MSTPTKKSVVTVGLIGSVLVEAIHKANRTSTVSQEDAVAVVTKRLAMEVS